MRHVVLILLLVIGFNAHPSRRRKRGGPDTVIPNMDPEIDSLDEEETPCYFSVLRKTTYEKMERPKVSEVDTKCEGPKKKMKELIDEEATNSLGTSNLLDMILSRGAGEFDWNYNNPAETGGIGGRYICQKHIEELGTHWDDHRRFYHYKRKKSSLKKTCSLPHPFTHHGSPPVVAGSDVVEKGEARAALEFDGILLHIGLPVCPTHKIELEKDSAQRTVQETGHSIHPALVQRRLSKTPDVPADIQEYAPSCSQDNDPTYFPPRYEGPPLKRTVSTASESAKKTFSEYLKAIGQDKVMRRKDYRDIDERSQRRKAMYLKGAFDVACEIVAPDSPNELMKMVISTELEGLYERRRTDSYETLMKAIRNRYLAASSRLEKLHLLSIVTPYLSLAEVERYIPGLTEYSYTQSKRLAHRGKEVAKDNKRMKYSAEAINRFIEFITSFKVSVTLPFGTRTSKLSDGSLVEYPNILRQHSATEIIELYKRDLEETKEERLLMSAATMYRILSACSATRRKSLHGVDFFVADAMVGFDDALGIVEGLKISGDIDEFWATSLRMKFLEAKQYLRTDYKVHIKQKSRIADHCIGHAISDPKLPEFSEPCQGEGISDSHIHDLVCDRCELVKIVTEDLRATVEELRDAAADGTELWRKFDRTLSDVHRIETRIDDLKRHQIRATASERDRDQLVASLEDNEALITLDWAMKLLPMFSREKTTDFFAKRGISWHISHVLARVDGDLKQHTFIHIMKSDLQDTVAVTSAIGHILSSLSKVGITKVHLRSDNAGCYKSSATIASLPEISLKSNVKIASYFFSEAQAGKSACDRYAAVVKRKLHDYVDSGHDVINADQFYQAVLHLKELAGLSVYVRTLADPKPSPTKIPLISTLNTFVFEEDGVRAYRHSRIGTGKLIPYSSLTSNSAIATNQRKGGKLPGTPDFWSSTGKPLRSEKNPPAIVSPGISHDTCPADDSEICSSETHLFRCPVDPCISEFLSSQQLARHLLLGKHRYLPERLTLRDISLQYYTTSVEGVQARRVYPDVDAAIESLEKTNDNGKKAMQGWALRDRKRGERLPERSKEFIKKIFDEGWRSKVKSDPRTAEARMRNAVDDQGRLMFAPHELLNYRQIASMFSRLAQQQKKEPPVQTESTETDEALIELFSQEGDEEEHFRTDPQFETEFDINRDIAFNELQLAHEPEIGQEPDAQRNRPHEELF